MEDIRILILDDNEDLRGALATFLNSQSGFKVVGQAADGVEALDFLGQNTVDVMLLDMIMPKLDGFGVLTQLQKRSVKQRPEVIALTALGRDDFVRRAVHLGVSYYMIKPVEMPTLLDRIRDVYAHLRQPTTSDGQPFMVLGSSGASGATLDDKLSNLFLTLGIPAHIKGYQFLREAIKLVIQTPELIGGITKELYPAIAKHFGTTASKVERAIRHAIEVAWSRGRVETLNTAFGCRVAFPDEKPTNGEFIALIADKLKAERTAS